MRLTSAHMKIKGPYLLPKKDPIPCESPIPPPLRQHQPKVSLDTWYGFMFKEGKPADPMISLTLTRGDGENCLAATGTHYKAGFRKIFTVTGKSGIPEEDGKIPMVLKFVYIWKNSELTGKFDPEEKSIRGTVTFGTEQDPGEFVFKRNPDFVRFYVSPSSVTARKRWGFATKVVLDKIRRDAWSPSYFVQRIKNGKRYMEMSIREFHYGRALSEDELKEYHELFSTLRVEDARFYASLITIKLADVPIQYVSRQIIKYQAYLTTHVYVPPSAIRCDVCGSGLGGARVICMDCHGNTTVDLCSEIGCLKSAVTLQQREDLVTPHTPNHRLFKVHRILHSRDFGRTERRAKAALDGAREMLSDLRARKEPMPQCVHCKERVSEPCWFCVDCTGRFQEGTVPIITFVNIHLSRREVYLRWLRVQMPCLQRRSHQEAHSCQGRREARENNRFGRGQATNCRGTAWGPRGAASEHRNAPLETCREGYRLRFSGLSSQEMVSSGD